MALFNGTKKQEGSRSNTHLVKSGHMSPATDWKLDPKFKDVSMASQFTDGVLFNYQYGGPGDEAVVIPKGRLVGVAAPMKDFEDGIFKTVITLPGLATNNNVVGVAPFNFTKDMLQDDRFGGNHPVIITLDYITVPYMPGIAPADPAVHTTGLAQILDEEARISKTNKMPWGALIGAAQEGDYVKATASGRFTKFVPKTITQDDTTKDITIAGDDEHLKIGQILEMDLNQTPWGWMQWVLFDESARKEDDAVINRSGASNLPSDAGYPMDPAYKEGLNIFQQYQTEFVTNPTGIPGLHDGSGNYYGYGKNDTEYANVALATLPGTITGTTSIILQAKDAAGGNLTNLFVDANHALTVKIDTVAIDASRVTFNAATGQITISVTSADQGKAVTASYFASHYGTPSYLDFKGVVGSASILLKM